MLKLYAELFEILNREIPYAVWKACHELAPALDGKGDIDLLVDPGHQGQFRALMAEMGFVHARFGMLTFPGIGHYYGYDEGTGKTCHVHAYFQILTGESHIKSYRLPLEGGIIENRFLDPLGVYEASFRDQALVYALRHYMKRASLAGFLLWAYEKQDYLREYAYIRDGLASLPLEGAPPSADDWRSGFDFQDLDMDTGLSGYAQARGKTGRIRGFRRYNAWQAALMSVRNLALRVVYKVFRVRKKLDRGVVIAVSGVDGSGKSSMVDELRAWLGSAFDVRVLHLGRPSPSPLTLPLRPLLFLYRTLKARRAGRPGDPAGGPDPLKRSTGLAWSLRYLALAHERHALARNARELAGKGKIVICDRFPTSTPGKMDSPRIGPGGSDLVERMRRHELLLYESLPEADGLLFLDVSMEEAVRRNRARVKRDKETDGEIVSRHQDNQGLSFRARRVFMVDADRPYEEVLGSLKSLVWECLLAGRHGPVSP